MWIPFTKIMKIIVESHVPFVGDAFAGVAETVVLPPEDITPEAVSDADALIIRTRTRCDSRLLDGSRVRFIATATIGTDHIDLPYCAERGIKVVNAPGCNAPAVAQYVMASVLRLRPRCEGKVLGVVGCGNVGSIVARWGASLGMEVMVCDPLREARSAGWSLSNPRLEGDMPFCSIDEIASRADIVTFHTPHTRGGACPTHHLAGEQFFSALKEGAVVINSARGPVADTAAWIAALKGGRRLEAVVDCWEGEPEISAELLGLASVATPHIAGYSLQGKKRATQTAVNEALEFMGSDRRIDLGVGASELAIETVPTAERIIGSYDPTVDTSVLRQRFAAEGASAFEKLRNGYDLRDEA